MPRRNSNAQPRQYPITEAMSIGSLGAIRATKSRLIRREQAKRHAIRRVADAR